jgi:branched-chain amino acid transport system permease protein
MSTFIQLVVTGLAFGCIYALVALGFVLINNAVGVVNFAQGEFVMVPTFIALTFLTVAHLPWYAAYLLTLAAVVVFGVVFQAVAYYPLRNRTFLPVVISTLGASILLQNLAQLIWGAIPLRFPGLFPASLTLNLAGVHVVPQHLLVLGVTGCLLVGQYLLFERTLLGKKLQAVAQDKDTARLLGIRAGTMIAITFAYSAVLGAFAGILVGPLFNVNKDFGAALALKAFSASIVGGFGSVPGAIVGGVILGLVEIFAAYFLSPDYRDAYAFLVMIAVLLIRPQGIFGEKVVERA